MAVCEDCRAGEHDHCDRAVAKGKELRGSCACQHGRHQPIPEVVCEECMAGDHETCRRGGGYLDDEDNRQRCGCHLTAHRLDNRPVSRARDS